MTQTNAPVSTHCHDDHDPDSMTLAQARQRMLESVAPVTGHERLAMREALHRVLAEPVQAPIAVPGHDNAAMDGYAVRGPDLPGEGSVRLEVVGTAWAGNPFSGPVGPGECVRIMTGAVVPKDCDTVVMQEKVRRESDQIILSAGPRTGENVRHAGEDVQQGQTVLEAGAAITPARLGLLASLGPVEVTVRRRPRVAFFSTGDELTPLGQPLPPGGIYDSNRHTLFGMLTELGVEVLDMGVIPDTRETLLAAFVDAAACADMVISTGGVSVGEADYIRDILDQVGRVDFWKVAIKPGRPLAFGRVGDAVFVGLPGNPVSAVVTFYQLVQPTLQRMMGVPEPALPPLFPVVCQDTLKKRPGRMEFQRGVLEQDEAGRLQVRATLSQSSGVLSSMSEANCFIVLDMEQDRVEPGEMVQVQPFWGVMP
ncbi:MULTISPECIES: gephyrin-like molybdotransferase Glp [unclassified Ectothiorhodospira]|uniref:molybdopterin molybdotransferase MoeA n=1 Tax=unclassified Ectothiorhodospira TaxID=2684909 RepID=UPI001EE8C9C2|nr:MULTISPECIES: gephyrin-like molybdotransferase Glp [unclassified Ectothiorhodospira]MCG5516074.1 molybdopterin molybdotransferase MoeA [Ectothiorhodospira sp. 9100]MCG5519116.1 molybdopterin molybdotransferase MoeA [Ectothiorhodospira sp. 9905]